MIMASTSNPSPWYLDPKYQSYWSSFNSLNIPEGQSQYSNPDDIRAAAYWRSLALGLQFENNQLHILINQMLGSNIPSPASLNEEIKEKEKKRKKTSPRRKKPNKEKSDTEEIQAILRGEEDLDEGGVEEESINNEGDGEGLEEYLKFVEETERHREERDQQRQGGGKSSRTGKKFDRMMDIAEEGEEALRHADLIVVDHERLKREMRSLYGSESLAVHCVETRLQLEFNEWSDLHRPVTWPALPLNIRR